jgi:hypothetical protein
MRADLPGMGQKVYATMHKKQWQKNRPTLPSFLCHVQVLSELLWKKYATKLETSYKLIHEWCSTAGAHART